MIELIAAGFLIGFMGSLHCVGMCGPLAVMLHANAPGNQVVNGMLYNAGRIITYTLLGVIIALIGKTFIAAGFQQVVSIISGCIILLILFLPIALKQKIPGTRILRTFVGRMKKSWSGILKQHTKTSVLAGGIINGFLPCGLVYVALVAALNAQSIGGGALFMTMFGLGTVPAMFLAGTAGNFFQYAFAYAHSKNNSGIYFSCGCVIDIAWTRFRNSLCESTYGCQRTCNGML
ncbi:MAG: sulfite exporter TauE/SafE family protein [Bacteroidetes bacterium]|nr:sulfite exporter TauE/SafE family protein [Bacteroidota bacterium]